MEVLVTFCDPHKEFHPVPMQKHNMSPCCSCGVIQVPQRLKFVLNWWRQHNVFSQNIRKISNNATQLPVYEAPVQEVTVDILAVNVMLMLLIMLDFAYFCTVSKDILCHSLVSSLWKWQHGWWWLNSKHCWWISLWHTLSFWNTHTVCFQLS